MRNNLARVTSHGNQETYLDEIGKKKYADRSNSKQIIIMTFLFDKRLIKLRVIQLVLKT